MKKLLQISALLLVTGVILTSAGLYWAHRDNVTATAIYGIIEENLKLDDSIVEYAPPERFDFGSMKNEASNGKYESELNEFNTLELYSDNCEIDISVTDEYKLTATANGCSLTAGITGGRLHIQAIGSSDEGTLKIVLPDSCKGGFVIKASDSTITLDSVESAMDMSFNIKNSKLSGKSLAADNITVMTSGSSLSAENISALDSLRIDGESSEFNIKKLAAKSTGFTVNSTTADISDISGTITANARMSALSLGFSKISGNIGLEAYGTTANVKLPKNGDLTLRHSESYGIFSDKTNPAQNAHENSTDGYTMETNIKFGIVTAAN